MNHLIILSHQTLGQKVKPLAKYLLLHFVSIWGILILGGFTNEEEGSTAKDY